MNRHTIRIPSGLIDEIDELVEQERYDNRSEAVRHAIREFLAERRSFIDGPGRATKPAWLEEAED